MVLRSSATRGGDTRKGLAEDRERCNTPTKEPNSELEQGMQIPKESHKSFTEVSTPGRRDQKEPGLDPSMITTFLETYMKLLHNSKVIKGLHELITRCAGSGEPRVVQKIGRHALRTRREMRMTAQISEYDMDQVILDLGSDVNVLPKKTWECMGKPTLQWSPIQLRMANQ